MIPGYPDHIGEKRTTFKELQSQVELNYGAIKNNQMGNSGYEKMILNERRSWKTTIPRFHGPSTIGPAFSRGGIDQPPKLYAIP